jgi:hypothetical protein
MIMVKLVIYDMYGMGIGQLGMDEEEGKKPDEPDEVMMIDKENTLLQCYGGGIGHTIPFYFEFYN